MARNPYHDVLDDTFRGERVRVTADGHTYEGWVRMWHFNQPAVVLYGAVRDGTSVGSVMIDAPKTVERIDQDSRIEELPVESIEPSPYSVRSFDSPDFQRYVRTIRDRGHLSTFPTVRPIDDGFEIVGGHKRIEAARRAGFESVPVRVTGLSDWEATVRFVDEHVPLTDDEQRDGSPSHHGWYDREDVARALERLRDDWDEARLRSLPAIDRHVRAEHASESDAEPATASESESTSNANADSPTDEDANAGTEGPAARPRPVRELETGLRTEFLRDSTADVERCELSEGGETETDAVGRDGAISLALTCDVDLEATAERGLDRGSVAPVLRRTIGVVRAVGVSRPIDGTIRTPDRETTLEFRLEPSWLEAYPLQLSTDELLERLGATAAVRTE